MPMLTTDRQSAVVAELKQHVSNFDLLPAEVQSSLLQGAMQKPVAPAEQPAEQARDQAVQQRFKELMRAANIDPDHPENWKSTDYPIRYACMDQAEIETPGHVAPTPTPEFVIDNDPDEALATARHEVAEFSADREHVREALARCDARIAKTDDELNTYNDLDDKAANWLSESFKSNDGNDDELPFALDQEMKARSRALDRAESARGAKQKLVAQLRHCDANVTVAERKLRAIASAIVMREAEDVAGELAEAEAAALTLQEKLLALAHSYLPGPSGGPATLPQSVVKAINEPRPVAEKREALILYWRIKHTTLIDGAPPWLPDDEATIDGETED